MNLIKSAIAATALAFALATSAAAQTPPAPATTTTKPVAPPAATTTAPTTTSKAAKTPAKPRTEISIQCSKDADAKSLHGTERKKFREACMKAKPKV
jgi:hypothetical protein